MWSQCFMNRHLGFVIFGFATQRVPPGHSIPEEIDDRFWTWIRLYGMPQDFVQMVLTYRDGGQGINSGTFEDMLHFAKDSSRGVVAQVEVRLRRGVRVERDWEPPPIEPRSRFEREDVV